MIGPVVFTPLRHLHPHHHQQTLRLFGSPHPPKQTIPVRVGGCDGDDDDDGDDDNGCDDSDGGDDGHDDGDGDGDDDGDDGNYGDDCGTAVIVMMVVVLRIH
jgi:hypothetical protein